MKQIKQGQIKIRLMLLVVTLSWLLLIASLLPWHAATSSQNQLAAADTAVAEPKEINAFDDLTLTAEAAVVYDIKKDHLIYQHQANDNLPIASITKVVTALAASQLLEPDQSVTISQAASRVDDITGILSPGSQWPAQSLINIALVSSSNRAAAALAEAAAQAANRDFIDILNQTVQDLDLNQTYLINPTGLDIAGQFGGSYSTAADIAHLFTYITANHSGLLSATVDPNIRVANLAGQTWTINNTNQRVGLIPGLLGSKTGYTGMAGGNLAIVFDAGLNRPIVVVVLSSNRTDRFRDVEALVGATVDYLNQD